MGSNQGSINKGLVSRKVGALLLLAGSSLAQGPVTTIPVVREPIRYPNKYVDLKCDESFDQVKEFLVRSRLWDTSKDSKLLFSVLSVNLLTQESKLVLRGTPFNTGDKTATQNFLKRLKTASEETTDGSIKSVLLKLKTNSEKDWEGLSIFDDDSAEETHLDMAAMRATLMYTLAKTIASQQNLDNLGIEATALKMREQERESIYFEYPEFKNLSEPNPYQILSESYRDLQVPSKMLSGRVKGRKECDSLSRLPTEERIFCRVVSVREEIVARLSREMSKPETRLKELAVRNAFRESTDNYVSQARAEFETALKSSSRLIDEPLLWKQLGRIRAESDDRLGDAYAFARRCEVEARNASRGQQPFPFPLGKGNP